MLWQPLSGSSTAARLDEQVARAPLDDRLGHRVFMSRLHQEAQRVHAHLLEGNPIYLDRTRAARVIALANERQQPVFVETGCVDSEAGYVDVDLTKEILIASHSRITR